MFFFFSLLWCEVRWLCSITTIYQPCDRSRQGVWRGTLSGRSPSPCGRLLPRRRGFCDFAFSAYISFTPTHAIHSGTTTALRRAHIEHLVLHNGTACPFSHLVFLSLSLLPSHFFFLPSAHHILLFPLLLNLLLSLTWQWQTIVCGAFTGSPPTN